MTTPKPHLGIIGAGKLGITLAQLALAAGYKVSIAGSGSPDKIQLTVDILANGASASTTEQLTSRADVIILALPLSKYHKLDPTLFRNKLIIDAMNYWWEVDGTHPEFTDPETASSERVQHYFQGARVIKALNHVGYHHLHDYAQPSSNHSQRTAIAIAGDDKAAVNRISTIIDDLGFIPAPLGTLHQSIWLEPGAPAFGAAVTKEQLVSLFHSFDTSPKGREVAQARLESGK